MTIMVTDPRSSCREAVAAKPPVRETKMKNPITTQISMEAMGEMPIFACRPAI